MWHLRGAQSFLLGPMLSAIPVGERRPPKAAHSCVQPRTPPRPSRLVEPSLAAERVNRAVAGSDLDARTVALPALLQDQVCVSTSSQWIARRVTGSVAQRA